MADTLRGLKGMSDLFPEETAVWRRLERTFARVAERFGYGEVRTPIVEPLALFSRTTGETSDIVTKEMYEFETRGDEEADRERVVLRPELTAPVMRALVEHKRFGQGKVQRLWYAGPIFRYAEVKSIRRRQGHQFGVELIGAAAPEAEIEVMELGYAFLRELGLGGLVFRVNSIGRRESRARYSEAIVRHVEPWLARQDDERRVRALKNPLRMLDTKEEDLRAALKGAPSILEFLTDEERARFGRIQAGLTAAEVPFAVDPGIVRGLDYYTETVFEVIGGHLGEASLLGGGRYDGLVAELGGPDTPCVGFGLGIERLLVELEGAGLLPDAEEGADVFVVNLRPEQRPSALALVRELRAQGLSALYDVEGRSSKSQMRQADGSGARVMAILGEDEVAQGVVALKRLRDAHQETVARGEVAAWLRA